ncbi:MAG: hypothetical protein ACOZBH_04130 [Patescibacteria group bacterium]
MKLIISTESNQKFSIALADSRRLIDYVLVEKPFMQSELVLQIIDKLFNKYKITNNYKLLQINDSKRIITNNYKLLDEIIVISGPGDFSAVRIGISIANALSYAWSVPVKAVKLKKKYKSEESKLKDVLKLSAKVNAGKIAEPVYNAEPNITTRQ